MLRAVSSCLIFLYLVDNGFASSGSLMPDDSDDSDYDVGQNNEKLVIYFQDDCASTREEALAALDQLLTDFSDCLYINADNSTAVHQSPVSGDFHAFVDIVYTNLECISDINIDYDDYCIDSYRFEDIYSLDQLGSCSYSSAYINLDSSSHRMWHLGDIDGSSDNYYNYFNMNGDNSGIDIYILDTGIRTTHQEFEGLNVGNHDWGFHGANVDQAHGTHVAGIAAGVNVGVHKKVKNIYSFAVCRSAFFGCFEQDIESGLGMVARNLEKPPTKNRRAVINMSWGGTGSSSDRLSEYFEFIYNQGGIMVAAAGNSAEDACSHWPAINEYVISVGSYNENKEVSYYSNYGSCVDIYAPGEEVISSVIDCDYCYARYSGTSMASPALAGLIANLLAVDQSLTFEEIKSIVTSTSNSVALSNCPGGTCRGITMSCNTISGYQDASSITETTNAPGGCSSDADYYDCAVLSDMPVSLGMDVNGVYTNTGECFNGKAVYKQTVDDIGDTYLFWNSWWYINYIWCKRFEDATVGDYCQAYISGRSTFEASSSYMNYYSYTDFTFSDDRYTSAGTAYASLEGSNSASVCGSSHNRVSNTDTDTSSDDSDVAIGVEAATVSFSNVDEDSSTTTNGGDKTSSGSNNNNNSNDDIDWWVWLIIALFAVTVVILIGVVIYYQRQMKQLRAGATDGSNYRLMG